MANNVDYLVSSYDKFKDDCELESEVACAIMVLALVINSISYTMKKRGDYE